MFFLSNLGELFFLIGVFRFLISVNHFMCILISLEFIIFSLYYIYSIFMLNINIGCEYLFLFFSMIICEGVFALCLLVNVRRFYGNDLFNFSF